MNDTDLLTRITETDAYAPHLPLPDGWSSAVAFAQIDRRMDMLTEERLTEGTPVRPPRKGLAVAIAAFVVVILGGLAVGLLGGGTDEVPPVDSPTTIPPVTTTIPPVTTTRVPATTAPTTTTTTAVDANGEVLREAQTLMEGFVAAFNGYDADDWLSLWADPQYTFTIQSTTGIFDESSLRERILWGQLFHEIWTLDSCRIFGTRASCTVTLSDAFTEAASVGATWLIWSFEPVGEQIADVRLTMTGLSAYAFATTAFQEWVNENHPEAGTLIHVPSGGMAWRYNEEVALTVLELLPEYAAALTD